MKEILSGEQVKRTLRRMTHEIIERNNNLENIILVGVKSKGVPIGLEIKNNIKDFTNIEIPFYELDISSYRDDKDIKGLENKFNVFNKHVILIDDVLYTGRTARAAMDALIDLGRFNRLEFLVLIDRGHRELPIRADYVGKNLPTNKEERIVLNTNDLSINIIK
ncbi:MAG TPA: bifunctional pyr operon transcriptional regulator/uracil phosphoribosyltransferase PyrR [Acholeplasma sp.]|nr:bifunctional pyr operon transcriptional regulator/uracil phosphoribosyltransferase PyrR [Acholeplasma sp.]